MRFDSKHVFTCLFWIASFCPYGFLYAQAPRYSVQKTPFSSSVYDEFSPYFMDGKLVYCSNRPISSMQKYEYGGSFLFNMFFVESKKNGRWDTPQLFAKELLTPFNDGPATFNNQMTTIFFSRNIYVQGKRKDINSTDNKIGLFSANYSNGNWVNITPFPYNNEEYSLVSPSLSADGKRIYFSSDMPEGHGGYDIYYCEMIDGKWSEPINVGTTVNSSLDETYPFISSSGKLFFASEGHAGFGGKDIFYTKQTNGTWQLPVHLDDNINSQADDFGFITNDDMQSGYFSSNRKKTDDIFSFKREKVSFDNCLEQQENNYCFVFYDENVIITDTISSVYEWQFGDDEKILGKKVKYCFPGPGKYSVVLRVMNDQTGDTINVPSSYDVELKENEQAYINATSKANVGDTLYFDGLKTNLPNFTIKDYLWDFGNGFEQSGASVSHQFMQSGEYLVKLGLIGTAGNLEEAQKKCVCKKISIMVKEE